MRLPVAEMSTNDPDRAGTDATAAAKAELRTVFGAFPSGVVAVCAQLDRNPVGMAVSSFTPVSLHPPLITVCIQSTSSTWPQLREAPNLGVSVLGEHHERACRQLASKDGDRFDGVETVVLPSGSIRLRESCAWFDCSIESELAAGDHLIVVLRIEQTGLSKTTAPLVFHQSRFRRLTEAS